jgi:hypothetical protein
MQEIRRRRTRARRRRADPGHAAPGHTLLREEIPREGATSRFRWRRSPTPQADRLLKRLKTEFCSCGCPHTIDQCLIDDPACSTARTLALQVLREVTTGTP